MQDKRGRVCSAKNIILFVIVLASTFRVAPSGTTSIGFILKGENPLIQLSEDEDHELCAKVTGSLPRGELTEMITVFYQSLTAMGKLSSMIYLS